MLDMRILSIIPTGHENAITSTEIAKQVGVSPRTVRDIIERMVIEGKPIGSSSTGDKGYYIIVSAEDLQIARRHLIPRAVKIIQRAKALDKLYAKVSGQIEMLESINKDIKNF